MKKLEDFIGKNLFDSCLHVYYNQWKFKHPNASDFVKLAQDVSDIQLGWYKEYFVYTTKTIDYSIDSLWEQDGLSKIRLRRIGEMPMPIDLKLTFRRS